MSEARRLGSMMVAMVVIALAAGGGSVWASQKLAGQSQAETDRRVCEVVAALDNAYNETPPQTPAGKNLAEALAGLRRDPTCKE